MWYDQSKVLERWETEMWKNGISEQEPGAGDDSRRTRRVRGSILRYSASIGKGRKLDADLCIGRVKTNHRYEKHDVSCDERKMKEGSV
jgi:hypothetical protein